jgi:4-hydroxyproline epimerase
MNMIRIIDSHTAGEPIRVVMEGGPPLGDGPLSARVERFRERFDRYRIAVVGAPRGAAGMVGALLCPPHRADCELGVIFFDDLGYLGMCTHGTIGVVAALAQARQLMPGLIKIDTPAGPVDVLLHPTGEITVSNVASYRRCKQVALAVTGVGEVLGDVAWGGHWFFLVDRHSLRIDLQNIEALTEFAARVRQAANMQGHPEVDHVELFVPSAASRAHSRNFVLRQGKAYDRSPCGAGMSAKLACLAADGRLAEGEAWMQESVTGGVFVAKYRWLDRLKGHIAPFITGTAHVIAEATLRLDPYDPFCWGIQSVGACR